MSHSHPQASVSIGLPVRNGAPLLQRTVESLLSQRYGDFELIISDNASTDDTELVCRDFARRDRRVIYHRQPRDIGAWSNFLFSLRQARGEYFMWAAHDDRRDPDFLAEAVPALRQGAGLVACGSRVQFLAGDTPVPPDGGEAGSYPLLGSVRENLEAFIRNPGSNSRFYSLYRRQALLDSVLDADFWGADWALVINSLRYGGYGELDRTLLFRNVHGVSTDIVKGVCSQNRSLAGRLFPLGRFAMTVLSFPHVPKTPRILFHLARHNAEHTYMFLHGLWDRRRRLARRE